MDIDENDAFDDSVDPYDLNNDFEYDDGINGLPSDELEEDEDNWDNVLNDSIPQKKNDVSEEEMADYDRIDN